MIDSDLNELEWWSECCTAPPMYDIHIEKNLDPIGICMSCRDSTTFWGLYKEIE